MSDYHIYGIGAALVDTEIQVSNTDLQQAGIDKGVMTLVDEDQQHQLVEQFSDHLVYSRRASGGSAANSIIAASQFGANNFYSCKVADDENGSFYIDDLRAAGVDYHHDGLDDGITGKCLVMITPDAERTMYTYLGESASLSEKEVHPHIVPQCQYIYMEGYLVSSDTGRAAAIRLRELAEENGVKTSLSLSDPMMVELFGDGLQEMIGDRIDLLFCNEQEAKGFTGKESLEEAAEDLKNYARSFAITRGPNGSLVFDGNDLLQVEGVSVKAVDTNGAGDMFAGAFLYAITQGHSYETAGKLANHAAARLVTQYGPRLPAEQHAEVKKEAMGE